MSGHTKGPWEVAHAQMRLDGRVTVPEIFVRRPGDDVAIASDVIDPATELPSEANARLIAAAPDLYEALKALDGLAHSEPCQRSSSLDCVCDYGARAGAAWTIARAALSKAEGR